MSWSKYIQYFNEKVVRNSELQQSISHDKIILNDIQMASNLFMPITVSDNSPSSIMTPIFYLFDNIIDNKNISCFGKQLEYIKTHFNLDNLFGITTDNVLNISVSAHRTIFYKFSYNQRNYIYYSNSGLGSEKQLFDRGKKITSCKIFHVTDYHLFNNFQKYFIFIINYLYTPSTYEIHRTTYEDDKKKFFIRIGDKLGLNNEFETFLTNNDPLTHEDVVKIINYKKEHDTYVDQQIIYALLNLFCNKYPDKIIECTINYVIGLGEHVAYTNLKRNYSKTLAASLVMENNVVVEPSSINEFGLYINTINSKLQQFNKIPSVKYKFNNNFSLVYDEKYGLFNKLQESGSCTFYSYYNLAINMLILNNYKKDNGADKVVKLILTFHSYMMYLLCLNFDINCFSSKLSQFNSLGFDLIRPIYDILIKEKIADELITMYGNTLLFNPSDNIFVDNYYSKIRIQDIKTSQIEKILNTIRQVENFSYIFENFYKCINKYLHKIRTRDNFEKAAFRSEMRTSILFENLMILPSYDNYTIFRYMDSSEEAEAAEPKSNENVPSNFRSNFPWEDESSDDVVFSWPDSGDSVSSSSSENNDNAGGGFKKKYYGGSMPINIIEKYYYTLCEIWIFYISVLKDLYDNNFQGISLGENKFEIDTLLNFYIPRYHKDDNSYMEINSENDVYKSNKKIGIETNNCQVLPFIYLSFDELFIISTYINKNRTNFLDKLREYDINYSSYIIFLSLENKFNPKQKNKITIDLFNKITENLGKDSIYCNFLYDNRFCVQYLTEDTNVLFLKYLNFDSVNYNNYFSDNSPEKTRLYIYLYYIELTHKINNEYILDSIKDHYRSQKQFIKKLVTQLGISSFFDLYILLDEKLLIIDNPSIVKDLDDQIFQYLNSTTEVYLYEGVLDRHLEKDLMEIYNKSDNNEQRKNDILIYFSDSHKIMNLLEKFGLIVESIYNYTIIVKKKVNDDIEDEGKDFEDFVSSFYEFYSNNLELILYSFGINIDDTDNYTIVTHKSNIKETIKQVTIGDKQFKIPHYTIEESGTFSIFVIIHSENKILELQFDNGILMSNNCYLHVAKEVKYQLILNLNKKKHPFINYFPENAPYLCYNHNNNYNLLYILNSKTMLIYYRLTKAPDIKDKYMGMPVQIFHLTISPSELFPKISSFNNEYYLDLFKCYDNTRLNLIDNNVKERFHFTVNDQYNDYINIFYDFICDIISCEVKPADIDRFDGIIHEYLVKKQRCHEDKNIQQILHSFISENRFIDFTIDQEKKVTINNHLRNFIGYKESLIDNYSDYNLSTRIYMMQFNLIINYINQILSTDITSGDLQGILNSLECIKYFNTNTFQYYNIEILFLLQNEYFFKQSQLDKYLSIRNEMEQKCITLKLHQFMMGKGKTSVFTPLLSFYASIVLNKTATIITLDHLTKDTHKYIAFLEILTNNQNINIFSDSDAKKRWLLDNDTELKSRNASVIDENEINIIDEIDTQHNYLNSMLNLVNESGYKEIDKKFILYTFDYTINNGDIRQIENEDYFCHKISELFTQCELMETYKKMEFNRTYGFDFIYYNKNEKNRLCIPFVRKDTPQKYSKFTNIFLSMILTIKAYRILSNNKFTLLNELYDFDNLLRNINILKKITDIIDQSDAHWLKQNKSMIMYNNIKKTLNPLDLIKKYFDEFYSMNNKELNKIILKEYLYWVNIDIMKYSTLQYNASFQDIIYNNHNQWQVGYTGTAYLELNDYFKNENFLFKCIDEDPDEFIEIKLAFNNYTNTKERNSILIVNESDNTETIINSLITHLKKDGQNARGIVDLAGIFINLQNKEVAKIIKSELNGNNIVYFEDNHEAYEYSPEEIKKYTPSHKLNFYYYDNCHIVGSDLKQPYEGHIAIIINKYTRYTDFAQALFRFRKINRGTYMSIIYVKNNIDNLDEQEKQLNYDNIYELLQHNENSFNQNQNLGIQFQLLKTIIRKQTKNYLEKELINITLKNIHSEKIVGYLNNNILGISDINRFCNMYYKADENREYIDYIKKLYDRVISNKELLHKLIFDNNQIQTNREVNVVVSAENSAEAQASNSVEYNAEINRINQLIIRRSILIDKYRLEHRSVIRHQECEKCKKLNCTPLFKNSSHIMINNKPIYISYNLLVDTRQDITYFCFVEFNDIILIENEKIGIDYYIYRLPVYNYKGELIVFLPETKPILNIDSVLISLFGIQNYLSLEIEATSNTQINLDQLTDESIIILGYHYIVFNKLYSSEDENVSYEAYHELNYILPYKFSIGLLQKINQIFDRYEQYMDTDKKLKPNKSVDSIHNSKYNIYDKTLDPYSNNIVTSNIPISYCAYIYDFQADTTDGGYNTIYIKNKRKSKKKIRNKNRRSIRKYI
jgi:hypothetical protein